MGEAVKLILAATETHENLKLVPYDYVVIGESTNQMKFTFTVTWTLDEGVFPTTFEGTLVLGDISLLIDEKDYFDEEEGFETGLFTVTKPEEPISIKADGVAVTVDIYVNFVKEPSKDYYEMIAGKSLEISFLLTVDAGEYNPNE